MITITDVLNEFLKDIGEGNRTFRSSPFSVIDLFRKYLDSYAHEDLGEFDQARFDKEYAEGRRFCEIFGPDHIEAFIWDEAHGIRRLQDVLVNNLGLDLSGLTLRAASGISDDGLTIVGWGEPTSGGTEAWIARLPEPGTLSLVALGGLALLRGRK